MTAVFFVGLALAAGVIGLLLASEAAWLIATDIPNERSLHERVIPRVGGWGVIPAAVGAAALFGPINSLLICIVAVLFFISYADDRLSLPIVVRMPIHAAAAALWLTHGPIHLSPLIALLAGCGIVWIMNLFNFMDGSDGLAGGMALFAFSTFAAVAASAGVTDLAVWSMALAGAAAGFLLFNFHPARAFLGDAGSVTVGFLAGTFGIWGWAAGAWPFWFPFLVSAAFFVDATVTLFRRVLKGERFWRAHREHYYQRLIRSGWSHRKTAVCEYALMATCSGVAIAMLDWSPPAQYEGLLSVAVVLFFLARAVDRRWAAFCEGAAAGVAKEAALPQTLPSAQHSAEPIMIRPRVVQRVLGRRATAKRIGSSAALGRRAREADSEPTGRK